MSLDFQFECVSTILLLKDTHGNIVKASKEIPDSFYNMKYFGNNIYYDQSTNIVWCKKSSVTIFDNSSYFQEEYTDITYFWNQIQKLSNDLEIDELTQISNLRAVNRMKERILTSGQSCILVMCDVNNFKTINDVYGHGIGDECLNSIAQSLKQFVSPKDLVARVGGDEFMLIFLTDDATEINNKMKMAQDFIEHMGKRKNLPLAISFGISLFKNGDDWDQKRAEADSMSYKNKEYMKTMTSSPKN